MLPHGLIVPTLQRVEDALEDLNAAGWELDQIAGNPTLPRYQTFEAEQKVAQAQRILGLVLPLVQEIMMPFAEEQAALKCDQEAVLQAFVRGDKAFLALFTEHLIPIHHNRERYI